MRLGWLKTKPQKWALGAPWTFLKREWTSVFVFSGAGILAAGLLHLLRSDKPFTQFYESKYLPIRTHFDGIHIYSPFIVGLILTLATALLPRAFLSTARGLRSWMLGVTSGLRLLPFLSAFAIFAFYQTKPWDQYLLDLKFVVALFLTGLGIYLIRQLRAQRPVREEDVQVADEDLKVTGTRVSDSDDPIREWSEDILV